MLIVFSMTEFMLQGCKKSLSLLSLFLLVLTFIFTNLILDFCFLDAIVLLIHLVRRKNIIHFPFLMLPNVN